MIGTVLLVLALLCVFWLNRTLRDELLYLISIILGSRSRHFVILSAARSGSTLLVDLLNNHPEVVCSLELLNKEEIHNRQLEGASKRTLLKYIKVAMFQWYGYVKGMSGFKIFSDQLRVTNLRLRDVLTTLNEPKLVILYRRNVLETYVSLEIAKRNNKWYSMTSANAESIDVDWEHFLNYANESIQDWKTSLQQVKNYEHNFIVSYEELCEDKVEKIKGIIEFLCLPELEWEYLWYSVKQNPKPLEKKVSNYKEITENMRVYDQGLFELDVRKLLLK